MSVKTVVFEEASATADWVWQYRLLQPDHETWDADEEIVLGMSPDFTAWDDYGYRSRSFPPVRNSTYDTAPFFQASSADGTGTVILTDPNLIEIRVPYGMMRQMGPGTVHVSLSWRRTIPVINPLINDPDLESPAKRLHKQRIWAKRLGVPIERIANPLPTSLLGRTTVVTGTLPVIDGVV